MPTYAIILTALFVLAPAIAGAQTPALPSIGSVPDSALIPLAKRYLQAGDTATASAAIRKSVDAPGLSESERAKRLANAIAVVMNHGTPEGLAAAERLAVRLDGLSVAVTPWKVAGHQHLLADYRALDNDAQIFAHASRILALAPALRKSERAPAADALASAYVSLARVYGDRAQTARAIEVLHAGLAAAGDLPTAGTELNAALGRYEQVGHAGAPIDAQYWYNAPTGTTRFTPGGAVTLIEFTAHWCGPCRKSYPAIHRLQDKYRARGLHTLFVTTTYGFFKDQKSLSPAREAAADSAYYLGEHALPVQVAVYDTHVGGDTVTRMPNETSYKVGGIPQIVLLDKMGIVRMIVVGWDPASEAHLGAMLDTLLAERGAGAH